MTQYPTQPNNPSDLPTRPVPPGGWPKTWDTRQEPTLPPAPPIPPKPKRSRSQKALLAVAGVVLGLFILGSLGNDPESTTTTATPATNEGISTGLGTKDASGDVRLVSYDEVNDGLDSGEAIGVIEIINHSEGTSDYYIELSIESADGTIVDWTNAVAQHVAPGQKARTDFSTFNKSADKAIIVQVQRTASS